MPLQLQFDGRLDRRSWRLFQRCFSSKTGTWPGSNPRDKRYCLKVVKRLYCCLDNLFEELERCRWQSEIIFIVEAEILFSMTMTMTKFLSFPQMKSWSRKRFTLSNVFNARTLIFECLPEVSFWLLHVNFLSTCGLLQSRATSGHFDTLASSTFSPNGVN